MSAGSMAAARWTKSPSTNSIRSSRLSRRSLLPRDLQRRRRPIDEHGVAGAGPEQLLVDDADPTADIEDGRAGRAVRRQELEQHPRRLVRPVLAIPVAVALGVPPIEDRREPFRVAPAAVHRRARSRLRPEALRVADMPRGRARRGRSRRSRARRGRPRSGRDARSRDGSPGRGRSIAPAPGSSGFGDGRRPVRHGRLRAEASVERGARSRQARPGPRSRSAARCRAWRGTPSRRDA